MTQGDGTKIAAFKFGEPGEEASGNRADALGITVTAQRAERIAGPWVPLPSSTPDGSKRCKKFYQPHVELGDEIDVNLNSAGFGDRVTHTHKRRR